MQSHSCIVIYKMRRDPIISEACFLITALNYYHLLIGLDTVCAPVIEATAELIPTPLD